MSPAGTAAPSAPAAAPMSVVPFIAGTYEYDEPINSQTLLVTAAQQDLNPIQITPGGYLRGVTIIVTSSGGTLGTGVVSPDNPFSVFNYITLESIDGTPIIYPMSGYSHYLSQRFTRPFDSGDPALDNTASFSATINPAFRMSLFTEQRATLGVLPNTDARAQYRLRMALNPLSAANGNAILTTLGTATAPTVTVQTALQVYAQPPRATLTGAPIQQVPDGIAAQRFLSNQFDNVGTGQNTVKLNRVGNLIRTIILVFRDTNGVRTDLTTDPIRLRVDNTQLFVENRITRDYLDWKWYQMVTAPGQATSARPTGVYVFPRWQDPGNLRGVGWLETSPATFLQWEVNGAAAGGTMQQIIEDLALVGPLPAYLENI
jgi:hypothetical protein